MSSDPQSWQDKTEERFLEGLRARYEGQGFTFTAHPKSSVLPEFLGSYIPDALAQKQGQNIAIEVKRRPGSPAEHALRDIRRLFEERPDWRLHVAFMGEDPSRSLTIPAPGPDVIRAFSNDIRALLVQGHHRPAFVMAWSLLEAVLRARDPAALDRPLEPGAVVQTLAMNGYIEPGVELPMRALVALRNRIVHGDLAAEPTIADVELVLRAVEDTLSADASRRE